MERDRNQQVTDFQWSRTRRVGKFFLFKVWNRRVDAVELQVAVIKTHLCLFFFLPATRVAQASDLVATE